MKLTIDGVIPVKQNPECAIEMKLQDAARYALLLARGDSVVRKTAALCLQSSSSRYARELLAPALFNAAASTVPELVGILPPDIENRDEAKRFALLRALYPLAPCQLNDIRAIWRKIDTLPLNKQRAFAHLFHTKMRNLHISGTIPHAHDIFQRIFFQTLEFVVEREMLV